MHSHQQEPQRHARRTRLDEERPTPDEIRTRCREIQQRWSDAERARRGNDKPQTWSVPRFEGEVPVFEPPAFA